MAFGVPPWVPATVHQMCKHGLQGRGEVRDQTGRVPSFSMFLEHVPFWGERDLGARPVPSPTAKAYLESGCSKFEQIHANPDSGRRVPPWPASFVKGWNQNVTRLIFRRRRAGACHGDRVRLVTLVDPWAVS